MSGLFRSVSMTHVQLIMTEEGAGNTFQALGSFKKCHLIDRGVHDSAFFKKYKKRHMDCIQWEKKLQGLRDVMVANGVTPPQPDVDPDDTFKPSGDILESVENYVLPIENDLNTHINFKREHLQSINEEVERAYVLQWMKNDNQSLRQGLPEAEEKEIAADETGNNAGRIKARNIVGAILVDKQTLFERMVFRVSKGRNALIRFSPIDALIADPSTPTGELVKKSVFSCVFVGEQLNKRIQKICALFNARTYEIPENNRELDNQLDEIRTSLAEKHEVLARTNDRITKILEGVAKDSAGGSPLVNWEWVIRKERMIAEALKKCYVPRAGEVSNEVRREAGQQMVVARAWVPTDEKDTLSSYLREASKVSGQQNILQEVNTAKPPPTYFRTGKITGSFQAIVDTYGIPRYQEANPGLFTCVTFPFLFGVMYGDVFHGTFLTLFGIYLVWNEKKFLYLEKMGKLGEIFGMCFGGRYLILLMGMFAIYCGSLYNDCAAVPMNVWGSRWKINDHGEYYQTGVYPWGIDPTWAHKGNELSFFNSVKMKLAIVLGVTQMCFGVLLGLFNNLYFKKYLAVYFEFFPRMLFMLCTFGYMAFIIVYKMFVDYSSPSSGPPPSLISVMIGMFLSPGHITEETTLYPGQAGMQVFLLLVALISVPMMLFPLPCINRHLFKKRYGTSKVTGHIEHELEEEKQAEDGEGGHGHGHAHGHGEEEEEGGGHGHGELGPHYDFSDHLITLSIHTVEFVLGSVSNTASYLRLWALSLAHAQLAKVFWEKILQQYGFENGGFFSVVGFGAWAGATIAVLLCMDTLECFLHALRLHWVEFQNKFFYADGYAFTPFDFARDEKTA